VCTHKHHAFLALCITYPHTTPMYHTRSQEEVPVGVAEELQGVLTEEGESEAEVQECSDHRPSSFEKGEP
jgi:hypothetical protein